MFTIDQIKAAHSKVKSGADFPRYITAIKQLGVIRYETFVSDGHTHYFGENNFTADAPAKYNPRSVHPTAHEEEFKSALREHQQGKTDFPTFIEMCANFGIQKWTVDLNQMTCTYYDQAGQVILVEKIPQQ